MATRPIRPRSVAAVMLHVCHWASVLHQNNRDLMPTLTERGLTGRVYVTSFGSSFLISVTGGTILASTAVPDW